MGEAFSKNIRGGWLFNITLHHLYPLNHFFLFDMIELALVQQLEQHDKNCSTWVAKGYVHFIGTDKSLGPASKVNEPTFIFQSMSFHLVCQKFGESPAFLLSI